MDSLLASLKAAFETWALSHSNEISLADFERVLKPVLHSQANYKNTIRFLWKLNVKPECDKIEISDFVTSLDLAAALVDQREIKALIGALSKYRSDPRETFHHLQQLGSPDTFLSQKELVDGMEMIHKSELATGSACAQWAIKHPLGLPTSLVLSLFYTINNHSNNGRVLESQFMSAISEWRIGAGESGNSSPLDNPVREVADNAVTLEAMFPNLNTAKALQNRLKAAQDELVEKEVATLVEKEVDASTKDIERINSLMNQIIALQEDFAVKIHHAPCFFDLDFNLQDEGLYEDDSDH